MRGPDRAALLSLVGNLVIIGSTTLFIFILASPKPPERGQVITGALFALLLALMYERDWRTARTSLGQLRFVRVGAALVGAAGGTLVGLALGAPILADQDARVVPYAVTCVGIAAAAGATIAVGHLEGWQRLLGGSQRAIASPQDSFLIDTSALIDGRVADLIEEGFLTGNFYVPEFIVRELQQVADSSRARVQGRRGLAVLQRLTAAGAVSIRDIDRPDRKGADEKLRAVARETGVTVITNDTPLKSLCEQDGIPVLSVHDLADAVRPVIAVGDRFELLISGRGARRGQGTGHLPGGEMVVVEDGQAHLGQTRRIVVHKVISRPSESGDGRERRTIFARLDEDEQPVTPRATEQTTDQVTKAERPRRPGTGGPRE